MHICLLGFAILVSARADDIPKPAVNPASSLERALADDWGPACEIGGKSYAMEDEDESPCKDRGGKVTVGPRKKLTKLNTVHPRPPLYIKEGYQKRKDNSGIPSPYDHKDPLGN